MTLARLTQEAQDVENTVRLQMDQFHATPARPTSALTRAAKGKAGHTVRTTSTSPLPRQEHFMETTKEIGERLLLAEEEQTTDPNNSIDNDDLPSTPNATSEEMEQEHFMQMRNLHKPRNVKPPTIPYETGSSTTVGWKTMSISPWIIWHGYYLKDDHMFRNANSLTDPNFIFRGY